MDHRNSRRHNYQSVATTSTTGATSSQVYTVMSEAQKIHWTTFTFLDDDNTPQTVNVNSLLPNQVYRYRCACGCSTIFEATGSEIKAKGFGLDYLGSNFFSQRPKLSSVGETSSSSSDPLSGDGPGQETVLSATSELGGPIVERQDITTETDGEDDEATEFLPVAYSGFYDEAREELMAARADLACKLAATPIQEKLPSIGDVVWSKATGKGPFVILAETDINVSASRLLIKVDAGGDVREARAAKIDNTTLRRLNAWLVKTSRGRTLVFPQAELTLTPQPAHVSFFGVVQWILIFTSFIIAGYLLKH
jgi:hypothetical protein